MRPIVLDASVIAKLFVQETDSPQAVELLQYLVQQHCQILTPDLSKYEVASVVIRVHLPLKPVLRLYEQRVNQLIRYVQPALSTWELAEEIVRNVKRPQHAPSLYDSIYHALAIELNGILVTADEKHLNKTPAFENKLLLRDWQKLKV